MTVEDASNDNFPVGMRVLAVDDNPTCLKVLETLLRRCDYQVTTTNQAITALNLLMENKDKFDLVISDVHMPDMDGFKLLELVGLEMDIPVIMLSGNSDTKAVMRGITHGACDYLLKPVRIEELKNIWQHVVRRKKNDSKENGSHSHGNEGEKQSGTGEGGQTHETVGANDSNGKLNRKRKDQNEEEDDDFDENSDDPATQKKPRVVWSVELHRKFVDAVNRLGIEKAVPKRILDLMNVEKLTRENVASHLQKYRLYLKRISNVTTEQANMAALLGGKDLGYLPMGSYDGLSDLQAFPGLSTLPKPTLSSFQAGGFAGQFNSPNNLGLCRLPSAGMIQLGHSHNSGNLMNNFGKLQQLPQAGSQNQNLLQGMPHSLELDQLQHIKLSSSLDDSTAFPIRQQQLTGVGCSNSTAIDSGSFGNNVHGASDNSIMLRGLQLSTYNGGSLGNQASNRISHLNSEPFNVVTGLSSCPPDHTRLPGTWQNNIPIRGFSSDALPMVDGAFSNGEFFPQNARDNISAIASQVENTSLDFSTGNVVSATMNSAAGDTKLLNFTNMQNNVGSSVNYVVNQKLDDHLTFQSASNSSIPYKNFGQTSGIQSENMVGSSFLAQNIGIAKRNNGDQKPKGGSPLEQTKLQGAFYPNNQANSFEDLMTVVRRRRV